MNTASTIKISLISMRANKLRTALTVLGVVIGIASVIIVFSAGEGIKGLVFGQIESFGGTDTIETEVKVPTGKKGAAAEQQSAAALVQGVQITTLKIEDMDDVNKIPNVESSYAAVTSQEQISYGNELKKVMIFGVSGSFLDIDKGEIEFGRFFTESEDKSQTMVIVLGSKIKEDLFGDSDPIGKFVQLRKSKFHVIGIMKERGSVMGLDFDKIIYLPVRTLQKRMMGIDHLMFMMHKVKNPDLINETAEEIREVIRVNHNLESIPVESAPGGKQVSVIGESQTDTAKDDFRVVTMKESMDILSTVTGAVTLLLLAIVAISLIVGGVGIMNIMYVTVTERTSEIGLRKAVGAKYADIIKQFLIESVLVTLIGGIIGIFFGILISWLISIGANYFGFDWNFKIPVKAFIVSLGFSTFFGLAFGLYPARKAAKLDPIEALRSE
jgi:putative ABC transport system permease protein